ncbi:MAG: DnaD domain protein [Peptococcaceae bacterium]|nr:DnaD domain protein [Peptococcaceae bacterium]MDH7525567.1 DnaD domain protein [Peptococcaceae bacterium]
MEQAAFTRWICEGGQVVLPVQLLEKTERLNLPPEHLGYLVLAMARCQEGRGYEELARDRWIKWCLAEGWARWQGQGDEKSITFSPLWERLYAIWQESSQENDMTASRQKRDFNFEKILKWLDAERGTLSITLREKQVIQEFNLKYGWSSDFILIFLQLAFERGNRQVHAYQPIAKRVYECGIDTVQGLINFMDEQDWVQYKAAEIKKCIGQYGGVTRPQREMYLKWQNQWKFSHELILRAAEETVRTNNPNFKYIDAILQDWYEKGVKNLKDAETVLREREKKNGGPKPAVIKKRINRIDHRNWEDI